jgi:hypothetical protein
MPTCRDEFAPVGKISCTLTDSARIALMSAAKTNGSTTPARLINNRIASWEKSTPPADWKTYRSRWDLLHRWPDYNQTSHLRHSLPND